MERDSSRVPAAPAPDRQTIVVTLPCEIDVSNRVQVREALASALRAKPKVVIADGTATEFCDCAAITGLVLAHRRAVAADAQLRVVLASTRVLRVVELIGAERVLNLYPSVDRALVDGQRLGPYGNKKPRACCLIHVVANRQASTGRKARYAAQGQRRDVS